MNAVYYQSLSELQTWKQLFREACQMEVKVFDIGLGQEST